MRVLLLLGRRGRRLARGFRAGRGEGSKFELLKEKIKKKLEPLAGKMLDQEADLVVKFLAEKMKSDAQSDESWKNFVEGLDKLYE